MADILSKAKFNYEAIGFQVFQTNILELKQNIEKKAITIQFVLKQGFSINVQIPREAIADLIGDLANISGEIL